MLAPRGGLALTAAGVREDAARRRQSSNLGDDTNVMIEVRGEVALCILPYNTTGDVII